MLSLEITSRHIRVRLDRFRRKFLSLLQIVFVNYLERESIEYYLFEILANACRVIGGDQSHLFGEWEIEKEDTTVRAIASLIINVAIRANVPPGMPPVYLA